MASGEMIYLSGICDTGIGVNFSGGMSSATLPKDSLMASTRSAFFSTAPFTVMLFNVDEFETTTERSC
jgi:hypothetical protein